MTVTPSFVMAGSILAGTAEHRLAGIETSLDITTVDENVDIGAIVDQAERMCFVLDALERPHSVSRRTTVNGSLLEAG
ncbi:MAG: hypothetical protein ACR2QK_14410 [Acidimicrobiales bacterium]